MFRTVYSQIIVIKIAISCYIQTLFSSDIDICNILALSYSLINCEREYSSVIQCTQESVVLQIRDLFKKYREF